MPACHTASIFIAAREPAQLVDIMNAVRSHASRHLFLEAGNGVIWSHNGLLARAQIVFRETPAFQGVGSPSLEAGRVVIKISSDEPGLLVEELRALCMDLAEKKYRCMISS